MHLIESYALVSGSAIDKCFIQTEPFVLPFNKYVTIHTDCQKSSARQYKYWDKVILLLQNNPSFNLPIVQIGSSKDFKHSVNLNLLGMTNVNELAYIIQNSSLHIGYDSFPMHLASHFDIKMVILFSYFAKNSGPYFSSSKNIRLLEPNFTKIKPSFSYNDPYDLINTIDPTIIYNNIIDLLQI